MLDKFTSRSRGFAFVEMGTPEEAESAVQMLNEQEFQGRALRVNIARPREERSPRREGGGGSRGGYRGGGRERGGGRSGGGYRERERY
jgi:RNA recognition motif-containing protein